MIKYLALKMLRIYECESLGVNDHNPFFLFNDKINPKIKYLVQECKDLSGAVINDYLWKTKRINGGYDGDYKFSLKKEKKNSFTIVIYDENFNKKKEFKFSSFLNYNDIDNTILIVINREKEIYLLNSFQSVE